jgi:hypothetical protein
MNRRELLQAGTALPLAGSGALAQISTAPEWKPELFDAHTNETVVALTELIIPATDTPGAKAAFVNRWLDRLLAAGPIPQRDAFLDGLHWLDGHAIKLHAAPFVKLTEAQQVAILQSLDVPANEPGPRFFRLAKMWTSRIYYQTSIGMRELNKGGRVPAASKMGCDHQHA